MLAAGQRLGHDPARLAHHARQAADVDAMVRGLPVAAAQAAAGRSHREAIAHLEALAPHADRLPIHERADLYELWSREEVFVRGVGLPHAMAAVELRRQVGDTAGVGAGLLAAARAAWVGADRERTARAVELALDRARRHNDVALESVDDDVVTTLFHVIAGAVIDTANGDYGAAEATPAAEDAVGRLRDRAGLHELPSDLVWAARLSALHLWTFRRRDDAPTAADVALLDRIVVDRSHPWDIGELALWLWLDGHLDVVPDQAAEPVRWLGDGGWERAVDWFGDRGMPFEQAVALSRGDTGARLEALRMAQHVGARALAARFRHDLRADGVTGLPRGPREATRRSPLGLTARQREVLALLADGLSNVEIAERLLISVRTVENHVSAILATLGATSRDEAVAMSVSRRG